MEQKFTNLDEAIQEMRSESVPDGARERGLAAMRMHNRKPATPVLLKVAGIGGVAAVVAIAMFPTRSGTGAAWAQTAQKFARAPRLHELMEMVGQDGVWHTVKEDWYDGSKYAEKLYLRDREMFDWRFDGVRSYHHMATSPYSTVRTIKGPNAALYYADRREPFLSNSTSLKEFIQDQKGIVQSQSDVTLAEGKKGTRYILKLTPKSGYREQGLTIQADADLETSQVVVWSTFNKGVLASRTTVEYPNALDGNLFEAPREPGVTLYDIDQDEELVRKRLVMGFGDVQVGNQVAKVRGVYLDGGKNLIVLWTGASPNGDLKQPIRVKGVKTRHGDSYGISGFTTSRVLASQVRGRSPVLNEFMGGMAKALTGPIPDTFTIDIPVYREDRSQPIKDKVGKTLGYRSKFLGYSTLKNVRPLKISGLYDHSEILGLWVNRVPADHKR